MLAEFQQALADLTASPALCISARSDPGVLRERYDLTRREFDRLLGIVRHPGMQCACIVYRANRLAPLAMNVPDTCAALGPDLRRVVDAFWLAHPETNVHFYVETQRFCQFLLDRIAAREALPTGLKPVLTREAATVAAALAESRIEDTRT